MVLAFFVLIEVVWFSCEPFQRQQLLKIIGRDDLAREVQLDLYYPLLSQLSELRLKKREQVLDKIQ
ncbi:MAG: hypothetical protein ACI9EX_001670 [Oleispira sp.]|jgi:hypothetical protein